MSSHINAIAAGGASAIATSMRASTPGPEVLQKASAASQLPEAPKVIAPKHIDIQFDPNKARQSLQEAVSILNQQVKETNRGLGFRMDEVLNAPVVTVVSESTGEVVRQIPNEVVVRVAHNIEKMKGFFFNSKA
jgi:flagellar protein FlaG